MEKIPVIFDVDTGLDDTMALFAGVNAPGFETLAVTATYGNTILENALRNTLNAMHLLGRDDIPVAAGASHGWRMVQHTSPHIHGVNGIGEISYPQDSTAALVDISAVDLIYDVVMNSKEKVSFFALGPCTNIADAIRKYPRIKENLDKIVFMGGGVRRGAASQCASVNVYHDPDAFRFLMHCGVPFHMCGGEHATGFVRVTPEQANSCWSGRSPVCDISYEMLKYYHRATGHEGENENDMVIMHDPACLLYLLEPQCFYTKKVFCDIELQGKYSYGMTVLDLNDVMHYDEAEKNIEYVYAKPECADYLSNKFLEYIANAL